MRKLATSLLLVATAGCFKQSAAVAPISHEPLLVDEAMQRRQFPRSVARYANGETAAFPTGFVLAHRPDAPKWAPVVTDAPLFVANVFALPVGYLFVPAWTPVTYPLGTVEPTYNAMPPLRKQQ